MLVNQVKVYWMVPRDPRCTLFPAGTNEEIVISLVPRAMWSKKEMDTDDAEDWRRSIRNQQEWIRECGHPHF